MFRVSWNVIKLHCRDDIAPTYACACWHLRHTVHTLYQSYIPHTSKESFEKEKYVYWYFQNEKCVCPSGGKWWPSNFFAGVGLKAWMILTLDGSVKEEALR